MKVFPNISDLVSCLFFIRKLSLSGMLNPEVFSHAFPLQ